MNLFGLKIATRRGLSGFFSSSAIRNTDEKIANAIDGFTYDAEKVSAFRNKTRADMEGLSRLLKTASTRERPSLESQSLKDIRAYESALRRQLEDNIKIITLLKKLIESEYLELGYDIRTPLVVFEDFITQLQDSLKRISFPKGEEKKITEQLLDIEHRYTVLLNEIISFIENELRYFSTIGADFGKLKPELKTSIAHATYLKQRAAIKQRINGKVRWIVTSLENLDEQMKRLCDMRYLGNNTGVFLSKQLDTFKKQFGELVELCMIRVDVSRHVVIESIVLQREKYEEITLLRDNLHEFYDRFLKAQHALLGSDVSAKTRAQINARIAQFGDRYQQTTARSLAQFDRDFGRRVTSVQEKDMRFLRAEQKGAAGVLQKAKKAALVATAALTLWTGVAGGRAISSVFSPGDVSLPPVVSMIAEEEGCAEWVINYYTNAFKLSKNMVSYTGVTGNAWRMFDNLTQAKRIGNKMKFNVFEQINTENAAQIAELKAKMKERFTELSQQFKDAEKAYYQLNVEFAPLIRQQFIPLQVSFDSSAVRVGDIVGLFYLKSDNQAKAFLEGTKGTFNTHVGIVNQITPDGKITVAHNIHKKVHVDPIESLKGGGDAVVAWIVQPSKLHWLGGGGGVSGEDVKNYEASRVKFKTQAILNKTTIEFGKAYTENYAMLSEYFGLSDSEMKMLIKMSIGTLGRESEFGKSDFYQLEKIGDFFLQTFFIKHGISRGPTQIRLDNFTQIEKEQFGITESSIYENERAALATFILHAKHLQQAKERGFKGTKLTEVTILSFNYPKIIELSDPKGTLKPYTVETKRGKFTSTDYLTEVQKIMANVEVL